MSFRCRFPPCDTDLVPEIKPRHGLAAGLSFWDSWMPSAWSQALQVCDQLSTSLAPLAAGLFSPDAPRVPSEVGGFPNSTPILPCPFQTVRAARKDPSLSIRSSNVSGTPKTLGNKRSAPPDDKLRTTQSITEPPSLKTIWAVFRVRARGSLCFSICGASRHRGGNGIIAAILVDQVSKCVVNRASRAMAKAVRVDLFISPVLSSDHVSPH